jgi:predicted RNA polymerase sigma factor
VPAHTTAHAITAARRTESARLIGALTRMTRDVALAEDLSQDAMLAALESSVRGDLLERAGQHADAAKAFAEAAAHTQNEGERALLTRRAEENLERTTKLAR